jgi:hypothetical protein
MKQEEVGKILARKGQEVGWWPPPLGHPPSLLLLYKKNLSPIASMHHPHSEF